jgi:hypothetical protein
MIDFVCSVQIKLGKFLTAPSISAEFNAIRVDFDSRGPLDGAVFLEEKLKQFYGSLGSRTLTTPLRLSRVDGQTANSDG